MSFSSAERRNARAELQAWYLVSLRPKLVRAAGSGIVTLAAAEALELEVRDLFDLPADAGEEVA